MGHRSNSLSMLVLFFAHRYPLAVRRNFCRGTVIFGRESGRSFLPLMRLCHRRRAALWSEQQLIVLIRRSRTLFFEPRAFPRFATVPTFFFFGERMTTSRTDFFPILLLPGLALMLSSVPFEFLSLLVDCSAPYSSSLSFSLDFTLWLTSGVVPDVRAGGGGSDRDEALPGAIGKGSELVGSSIGDWRRPGRFRFLLRAEFSLGEEVEAATSSSPGGGGVKLITVLSGKGSEGGRDMLELGTGIVTGSEGSGGLSRSRMARLTGRGFGLSFGFRAGVMASSSSVISMISSVYCVDRFAALRERILARSAIS